MKKLDHNINNCQCHTSIDKGKYLSKDKSIKFKILNQKELESNRSAAYSYLI